MIPRNLKTLLRLHAQFLDVRHSQMILSADRYISQSDLKVAKAGLQGAAGPLPEREERCPGDSVSDPAKTLFSCFSCVACGDTRKTGRER